MGGGLGLTARGLVKHFDGGLVRAVDGADLSVAAGEHVAIMGPTGCGKSTLLSLLALLEEPDAGELEVDGVPVGSIRRPDRWRAENVGIVFQLHHLLLYLTAEENVMLPLMGRGSPKREARRMGGEMLERIGLAHRGSSLATKLSGGERQLVAVARALVGRPRLILADEPTGSVDSRTGERVLDLLLGEELVPDATVVLVTHDAAVAARTGRTEPMLDGRLHGAGTRVADRARPGAPA